MKESQPIQDNINHSESKEDELNMNDNVQEDLRQSPDEDVRQDEAVSQETASNDQAADTVSLSEEVEKLRAENEEGQQRLLRTQADFDNFRRRTVKEKEELGKYASAKLITELLPVIDNFQRALGTAGDSPEAASYTKGVEMIFRQLEGVLSAEGLVPMETVGQPFNPEFHQAIMQVESEEYEEGIVVEEVQKGYMLKDKVLRPAMVKVSG